MAIAPDFDPNDITDLEQRHRDAMLELVLAWGSLDGALGILLSCVEGLPLDQGAELVGRRPNPRKLEEVCEILRDAPGGAEAASTIEKHKKCYELYARPRNRIAHSRCMGIWTRDREIVVFWTFEKFKDNELAVDRVPIQEMDRATRWARAMTDFALKFEDALIKDA